MTKHKKKRNKVYSGADAAITRPIVTHISAANRNKVSQWWFDRKSFLKPILITSAVVIFVLLLILELIRVVNGA
jgi:hypothetical protein